MSVYNVSISDARDCAIGDNIVQSTVVIGNNSRVRIAQTTTLRQRFADGVVSLADVEMLLSQIETLQTENKALHEQCSAYETLIRLQNR